MDSWGKVILPTLSTHLHTKEDMDETVEVTINDSTSKPLVQIAEALGQTFDKLDDFVDVYPSDPLVVIYWPAGIKISPDWHSFLMDLISKLKQSDHSRHFRKLLIVNCGNKNLPELLAQSPLVDHFQLWNAVTWEEIRLFAGTLIADETNEIRKAWMISSYCGVSNFDLEILQNLLRMRPMSLLETVTIAIEIASDVDNSSSDNVSLPDKNFGNEWHPPASLSNAWQAGCIIGASIERGVTRPWNSVSKENREAVAYQLIWQEQVSGLFPLLIQLGHELNGVILCKYEQQLIQYKNVLMEPGEMLDTVRQSNVRISNVLFEALRKLKNARNQLAHLEPIERRDLEAIWDIQLRVRGGQY